MIGPISEENFWPKTEPCPYQRCCGLLSMKPTNNVQDLSNSKIAVDFAEYQKRIGTDHRLPSPHLFSIKHFRPRLRPFLTLPSESFREILGIYEGAKEVQPSIVAKNAFRNKATIRKTADQTTKRAQCLNRGVIETFHSNTKPQEPDIMRVSDRDCALPADNR